LGDILIPVYVIEQCRYSFSKLVLKFESNEEYTNSIINKLKKHNILKISSTFDEDLSNLQDYDIEYENYEDEDYYIFRYVGVIIVSRFVIFCYPKYLSYNLSENNKHFKQVIKVIEKYTNSKKQVLHLQNGFDESSNFNLLSIMVSLIEDYYKNGIYSNDQKIVEFNGSGEILWNKTINEIYPLVQNNIPYYVDFYNTKIQNDDSDYFKLLHEVILTRCPQDLEDAKLLDLFSLTPINLNNKDLNDFGDVDYIKYKITKELNCQFNTHKQSVLKTMYNFLEKINFHDTNNEYFTFYGTNAYNRVWEEMCRCIFNDKMDESLINLELPVELKSEYMKYEDLKSIIDKPKWNSDNIDEDSNTRPFIPDLISLNKVGDKTELIIFDAKYYNFPSKKPGIEDITKQYLYELAFKKFREDHKLIPKNCFLFPSVGEGIVNEDFVELTMLKNIGLSEIRAVLLPVDLVNDYYLNDSFLDISKLKL